MLSVKPGGRCSLLRRMYPREHVLVEAPAFFTSPQKFMNGLLEMLFVLQALTSSVPAQNYGDLPHGKYLAGLRILRSVSA